MAARPRTLPAAIAPVLVGSAAAAEAGDDFRWGRVRRRPDRLDLHPDRHQPRQRLLRRQARRRHRRPARPGPGHLRRAGRPAARPLRDLARLRRRRGRRHLPGHRGRAGDPRRRRRLDRRRRPLHRGPAPYGYAGMGELFVFLFFGLVAVNGSYYVQLERIDWLPFWLSISVGLLSTAILVVNNVRDIDTDRRAGKRTLAVRLGRERTQGPLRGMRRRRLPRPRRRPGRRRRAARGADRGARGPARRSGR